MDAKMINTVLNRAKEEISKKQKLINEIENNPELILTSLFDNNKKSYYHIFVKALEHQLHTENYSLHHEFQKYLEKNIIRFFNNKFSLLTVSLAKAHSYPSFLEVKFQKDLLIRFCIYSHKFASFYDNEEELLSTRIQTSEDVIKRIRKEIEDLNEKRDNINKYFKTLRQKVILLFSKNKIIKNINNKIEALEQQIKQEEISIVNKNEQIKLFLEKKNILDEHFNTIVDYFENIGYEEVDRFKLTN